MFVFNYSAGPAMLPTEVLHQAKRELLDWQRCGCSVMELSHRGKLFMDAAEEAEEDLRGLLKIPKNYKVLFCQGGGRGQFSAVPMNLLGNKSQADYVVGGYWSDCAEQEARKYCTPHAIDILQKINGLRVLKPMKEWVLSSEAAYVHYCPNETIDGMAMHETPDFGDDVIVVADYSSSILSRPIDISRYGVIYAGAQKNIGPAGLTLVIVRDDLLDRAQQYCPSVLNYAVLSKYDSMFNTPPTFAWYLAGLVFKWIEDLGGLEEMARRNWCKAHTLYETIDSNDFYHNDVAEENRSQMNVTFTLADPSLEELFLENAKEEGLMYLKGHRAVGGLRASLYNAMPLSGVMALVSFLERFAKRHG